MATQEGSTHWQGICRVCCILWCRRRLIPNFGWCYFDVRKTVIDLPLCVWRESFLIWNTHCHGVVWSRKFCSCPYSWYQKCRRAYEVWMVHDCSPSSLGAHGSDNAFHSASKWWLNDEHVLVHSSVISDWVASLLMRGYTCGVVCVPVICSKSREILRFGTYGDCRKDMTFVDTVARPSVLSDNTDIQLESYKASTIPANLPCPQPNDAMCCVFTLQICSYISEYNHAVRWSMKNLPFDL